MTLRDRIIEWAAEQGHEPARRLMASKERAKAEARRRSRARPRAPDRKAAKAEGKVRCRREVRDACVRRARGRCEQCGDWQGPDLHLDHFWGRAREESVESCWMLCPGCHEDKTNNRPNRGEWLFAFGIHCKGLDYAEQVAKVEAAIAYARGRAGSTRGATT